MSLRAYFTESAAVLNHAGEIIRQDLADAAVDAVVKALTAGKPLLVCGNGGSAADAMHITGELVGRFLRERRAWKAMCLSAVITAWSNDYSFETAFSRQVEAYGEAGAILLGITTSGNSANVIAAFEQARSMEMETTALTGEGGGKLAPLADRAALLLSNRFISVSTMSCAAG
jgi:D-sedoheptulose 7-phosphate isomerase